MTRSTPSISFSGNMTPTSTMTMSWPYSRTIMFRPISPRPPRGMQRSASIYMMVPGKERTTMEYRNLGRSGLKVSAIGLGGNTFGNGADEAATGRIIGRALDIGVNFIDTADVYSRGVSEQFVGKAVKGRRHEALIATKVRGRMGDLPNDEGLSRAHIMAGIEASLQRLDTDYVDLYQVHQVDA